MKDLIKFYFYNDHRKYECSIRLNDSDYEMGIHFDLSALQSRLLKIFFINIHNESWFFDFKVEGVSELTASGKVIYLDITFNEII
jgi:hypothetical protein